MVKRPEFTAEHRTCQYRPAISPAVALPKFAMVRPVRISLGATQPAHNRTSNDATGTRSQLGKTNPVVTVPLFQMSVRYTLARGADGTHSAAPTISAAPIRIRIRVILPPVPPGYPIRP